MVNGIPGWVFPVLALFLSIAATSSCIPINHWVCVVIGITLAILALVLFLALKVHAIVRVQQQTGLSYISILKLLWAGKRPPILPSINAIGPPRLPLTSKGKAWHQQFLDMGFVPQHTITMQFESSLDNYGISLTHPTLPYVALVSEIPEFPDQTTLSLVTVTHEGVERRASNWTTGFATITLPVQGYERHVIANASPQQLMDHCARLQSPDDRAPDITQLQLTSERTEYVLIRAWSLQGFQSFGAFESVLPKDATEAAREAQRQTFISAWKNLPEFFLIKHNLAQGKPLKRPSQRTVARHYLARIDQSASDFLDMLHDRLDVRGMADTSAKAQRRREALQATQRSLPAEATGIDACDALLKNYPDYGLREVARFTHPVDAILVRIK